jgi:hypothetical protein
MVPWTPAEWTLGLLEREKMSVVVIKRKGKEEDTACARTSIGGPILRRWMRR